MLWWAFFIAAALVLLVWVALIRHFGVFGTVVLLAGLVLLAIGLDGGRRTRRRRPDGQSDAARAASVEPTSTSPSTSPQLISATHDLAW